MNIKLIASKCRLSADEYSIEPVVDCAGGTITSVSSAATYHRFRCTPNTISLDFFLRELKKANDVYECKNHIWLKRCVRNYLGEFIDSDNAEPLVEMLEKWCIRAPQEHVSGTRSNGVVTIGSDFFNLPFYETAFSVALACFPPEYIFKMLLEMNAVSMQHPLHDVSYPIKKCFINYFDFASIYDFVTDDMPDGGFSIVTDRYVQEGSRLTYCHGFRCSRIDAEKYLIPFTLFMQNWTLLVGLCLSVFSYGGCSFRIKVSTLTEDMQPPSICFE